MQNLKRLRQAKGITQTQLAEAAQCNQATISKMERGGGNATLDLVARIARALDVAPVELFSYSEAEQRYLEAFRSASPEKQRAVLVLLQGGSE